MFDMHSRWIEQVVLKFLLDFNLLCWLDGLDQANYVFLILTISIILQLYLIINYEIFSVKIMVGRAKHVECSSQSG